MSGDEEVLNNHPQQQNLIPADDTDTASKEHGLDHANATAGNNAKNSANDNGDGGVGDGGVGNDHDGGSEETEIEAASAKCPEDNASNDSQSNNLNFNKDNAVRHGDVLFDPVDKMLPVDKQQSLLQYSPRQEQSSNSNNNNVGGPTVMFDQPPPPPPLSSSGYFSNQYYQVDHDLQQQYMTHHHNHHHFPPPSGPTMVQLPSPSTTDLDAARQYYEARMREHALQYANAAAGAAWAAARIACSVPSIWGGGNNIDGAGDGWGDGGGRRRDTAMNNPPQQSYYTPAPSAMPISQQSMTCRPLCPPGFGFRCDGGNGGGDDDGFGSHQRKQQRTLWDANKHNNNQSNYQTNARPEQHYQQQEKMRLKKKRESGGNDSISSLGSESREHISIGHQQQQQQRDNHSACGIGSGGKYAGKKSNQRRRYNEIGDDGAVINKALHDDRKGDDKKHSANEQMNSQRPPKRGLYQGHSSKSSCSSLGSSNSVNVGASSIKKKNRSHMETQHSVTTTDSASSKILLVTLIGKNGVRALHELCGKYHWDTPTYNHVEPTISQEQQLQQQQQQQQQQAISKSSDNSKISIASNDTTFVMTVHVNGVELGRGRGGTKNSAKQDASRKAMSVLVPGVVFDPNGLLLDMDGGGSISPLLREDAAASGGIKSPLVGDDSQSKKHADLEPLSLDDLGPHLASQLAIGGDGVVNGRSSPDHSETSSISTAISEDVLSGGPLISGGPLTGRLLSSNIYPCASTTSGVSSGASDVDDEDENAYYSSRGASVCSTLLNAMWQIDARIWEPPSYTFDVCPILGTSTERELLVTSGTACCVKRKKVELPTLPPRRDIATHRMFQCTASINLYFPKCLVGGGVLSIMDFWESPLDFLHSNKCSSPTSCDKGETLQTRKRKDSFALETPAQPTKDDVESPNGTLMTPTTKVKEDYFQHKVATLAMGLTKREAKHKASAKLLASLFPSCNSMIEVKAEAEAARELYAARKVASQPKRPKIIILPSEENDPIIQSVQATPIKNDISLHALSLSEPSDGNKRIKWTDSTNMNSSFLGEVDAALECLQELDEGGRTKDQSSGDVGKIVLRRACSDDCDDVHLLLNKIGTSSAVLSPKQLPCTINEPSVTGNDLHVESGDVDRDHGGREEKSTEDEKNAERQLGEHSVILVLVRAIALYDPPLGCAILTLKESTRESRILSLDRLGYEEHLPRERFVECLELFTKNIHCTLDDGRVDNKSEISLDDIRSFLCSPPTARDLENVVDCVNGDSSRRLLQSVKEEDSEDDGSDDVEREDDEENIVDGLTESGKRKLSKPSKRSRVA